MALGMLCTNQSPRASADSGGLPRCLGRPRKSSRYHPVSLRFAPCSPSRSASLTPSRADREHVLSAGALAAPAPRTPWPRPMVVLLGGAAFCRTQKDIICSSVEWCGRFAAREFCAIVLQRVDVSRHSLRASAHHIKTLLMPVQATACSRHGFIPPRFRNHHGRNC